MAATKAATEQVLNVTSKLYVTKGPQLWVSKTLYVRGTISSKKLWDEFQRDPDSQ